MIPGAIQGRSTVGPMFAVVWHYWIGVGVFIPVMLITFVLLGQYLRKTQSPKYPRVKE